MKTRFYVCGLGYDENLEAIDYEVDFGDFDTYEEAYELFVKLQCRNAESFFVNASKVYEIDIRLEECEETDDKIECANIRNEWGIINPNFKIDIDIKKIAYEKYKLDWMLNHKYTLTDLMDELESMREENEDDSIQQLFTDWEYGFGFGSEIWVCFDEFIDNEYTDTDYMKQILARDEYQKYQEDLNMNNRINAIAEFAQKREEEIANKKKQAEDREEFLKKTILGWSDRIQQLIDTANACVKHGIKFYHNQTSNRNYDGGHFITDGWCHILGFEFNQHRPSTITRIGKEGGGCCDFDVFTDGKTITATGGSQLWALERFVESFDDFETKFYAYVDKVCKSK